MEAKKNRRRRRRFNGLDLYSFAVSANLDQTHDDRAEHDIKQQLKQEVASTFNHLENEAYKPIEDAYRKDPEDKDAASAYEIAARDLMLMRNKLQTLP